MIDLGGAASFTCAAESRLPSAWNVAASTKQIVFRLGHSLHSALEDHSNGGGNALSNPATLTVTATAKSIQSNHRNGAIFQSLGAV